VLAELGDRRSHVFSIRYPLGVLRRTTRRTSTHPDEV
jgi:hypothetical protein